MYYPIQIPYVLNPTFSKSIKYTEHISPKCTGFVICFWEMQPLSNEKITVENIIVTDGCIDLVFDYTNKIIGFSGMSKTNFNFEISLPVYFFGARLTPGAFYQLTSLPASCAMDTFLPIEYAFPSFDKDRLFSLPFEQSKTYFENFLAEKIANLSQNTFTSLFDRLTKNIPSNTKELHEILSLSPRQCQRLFKKYYGITPKMALNIIRFQKCLEILTLTSIPLHDTGYYDQSHFINDFKKNLGITPSQLIHTYQV